MRVVCVVPAGSVPDGDPFDRAGGVGRRADVGNPEDGAAAGVRVEQIPGGAGPQVDRVRRVCHEGRSPRRIRRPFEPFGMTQMQLRATSEKKNASR